MTEGMSFNTPDRTHCWKRRWQVWYEGRAQREPIAHPWGHLNETQLEVPSGQNDPCRHPAIGAAEPSVAANGVSATLVQLASDSSSCPARSQGWRQAARRTSLSRVSRTCRPWPDFDTIWASVSPYIAGRVREWSHYGNDRSRRRRILAGKRRSVEAQDTL